MPTIGQVVRDIRISHHIDQLGVEHRTKGKIKQSWLSSLESGKVKDPPPQKMKLLAVAIGTTVAEIYQRAGWIELPTPEGLSEEQREAFEKFRGLSPEMQDVAVKLIEELADAMERMKESAPERSGKNPMTEGAHARRKK